MAQRREEKKLTRVINKPSPWLPRKAGEKRIFIDKQQTLFFHHHLAPKDKKRWKIHGQNESSSLNYFHVVFRRSEKNLFLRFSLSSIAKCLNKVFLQCAGEWVLVLGVGEKEKFSLVHPTNPIFMRLWVSVCFSEEMGCCLWSETERQVFYINFLLDDNDIHNSKYSRFKW